MGQGLGVAAWLVEAHIEFGELNTTTLQQINPALTGGCFSLFSSLILTMVLSYIKPQHYDWKDMRSIAVYNDISKDVCAISSLACYTLHAMTLQYHCSPCQRAVDDCAQLHVRQACCN